MLFGLFRQLWLPCAILLAKPQALVGLLKKLLLLKCWGRQTGHLCCWKQEHKGTPLGAQHCWPHRALYCGSPTSSIRGAKNKLHCCTGALEALRFPSTKALGALTCPLHRSFQIPTICIRQKRHSLMGPMIKAMGGPMLSLCSRNSTGNLGAGRRSQLPGRLNVRGGALREEVNEV